MWHFKFIIYSRESLKWRNFDRLRVWHLVNTDAATTFYKKKSHLIVKFCLKFENCWRKTFQSGKMWQKRLQIQIISILEDTAPPAAESVCTKKLHQNIYQTFIRSFLETSYFKSLNVFELWGKKGKKLRRK